MTRPSESGNTFGAAAHLRYSDDGIWHPEGLAAAVSFPVGGHQECAEIEDASFWFRHRNRCIIAMARRFPPRGMIVDVGGGTGFVSLALGQAGYPTALVEPELAGARIARHRGVDPVVCATLEGAGFAPGTVAGIGLFDVIEHVEDDLGLLRVARSLLRPDGHVYLTVPAHGWLWSYEDIIAGHYRRYSVASLRRRLRSAGLRVDFVSYMFWLLPPAILLRRRLAGLVGKDEADDTGRYRREHEVTPSRAAVIDRLLDLEFGLIDRLRTVPFGSSCIAVASPVQGP